MAVMPEAPDRLDLDSDHRALRSITIYASECIKYDDFIQNSLLRIGAGYHIFIQVAPVLWSILTKGAFGKVPGIYAIEYIFGEGIWRLISQAGSRAF
jgi:hypothetical protein